MDKNPSILGVALFLETPISLLHISSPEKAKNAFLRLLQLGRNLMSAAGGAGVKALGGPGVTMS